MARSRNHCASGNATMRSLCTGEIHVTFNTITILRVAQQWFYGKFMSLVTMKRTSVFTQSAQYFYPTLNKSGISLQTFIKVFKIKVHGNPTSGSGAANAHTRKWKAFFETTRTPLKCITTFELPQNQKSLYLVKCNLQWTKWKVHHTRAQKGSS